jgi:hypothetical protein
MSMSLGLIYNTYDLSKGITERRVISSIDLGTRNDQSQKGTMNKIGDRRNSTFESFGPVITGKFSKHDKEEHNSLM